MKNKHIILFLLLLSCGSPPLGAESGNYSIVDLVNRVLTQNDLVGSSKARIEEKRFLVGQSRVLPKPETSFTIGQKRAGELEGSLYEISISQTFPFPGKSRLRSLAASRDVELSDLSRLEAELSLVSESVRLAYAYEMNRKKKVFAEGRLHQFELVKAYLHGNVFASPQKIAERRIVEARLRDIDAERIEGEAALKASLERLRLYFPVQENEPVIDVPWMKGSRPLEMPRLKEDARIHNPQLAAQKVLTDKARDEKALAAKEAWPDLGSSIFYGQETAGETERSAGLGISVPLPIFDRNKGNIQSLKMKIQAEESLLRFKERELISRLGELSAEVELYRRMALQYSPSVSEGLNKDLKETEAEFRKGRVDLLVYLELENEAAQTYYRSLDVQKSLAEKLAGLFALTGRKDVVQELQQF